MKKAKQVMEGTYKWKEKYKKTQKNLILNKKIKYKRRKVEHGK